MSNKRRNIILMSNIVVRKEASKCPFNFISRTCGGHYIFQFNAFMLLIAFHLERVLSV